MRLFSVLTSMTESSPISFTFLNLLSLRISLIK
uniref:Uncharacterized protein n=1 Tax=Arundo donax TaxID=35708 RepID=A0A0A9CE19_ARUDO